MCITGERELVSFANGALCRQSGAGSPGYLLLRSHNGDSQYTYWIGISTKRISSES